MTQSTGSGRTTGAHGLFRSLSRADVIAVATGAMFSSGFFLLPGVAAASTGSSVILAYVLASLLVVPAMLCKAELVTAMPRAGGTYYFLDRALGRWAGTVGGLGAWATLVLKTAFALVGFGAYVALFVDASPKAIGLIGGAVFIGVNLVGAKESTRLQRWLVGVLVGTLVLLILSGAGMLAPTGALALGEAGPFLTDGIRGLVATTAMVSVSYAGLTKVASIAEEVRKPDRALPSGMFLSLLLATSLYVGGVWVVVAALPPEQLHADLAPVATAASAIFGGKIAVWVVAIAALAAFLSTANAGILAAARYPMAMARDGRVPRAFDRVSVRNVPFVGVWITGAVVLLAVAFLDVASLAKLASAFQLLLFGGCAVAVIVMRESGISSYQPGYRVPLYPWIPLACIVISAALVGSMGWKAALFPGAFIILGTIVYKTRDGADANPGAIRHVFRRWGNAASTGLERELGAIVAERALEDGGERERMVGHIEVDERSPWAGRRLATLGLPQGVLLVFIDRGVDAFVPDGNTEVYAGDRLTLVGHPELLATVASEERANRRRLPGDLTLSRSGALEPAHL